jgi:exodeoxyribonuclease-5
MNVKVFCQAFLKQFKHVPTSGQDDLITRLSTFVLSEQNNDLFVIKGYAGTGKTSIIGSLVKILPLIKKRSVLLAPTGRAAKVLAGYSSKRAQTIHQKIYFARTSKEGRIILTLQENKHTNTIFIVDEASMIPDTTNGEGFFEGRTLLEDLLEFVYSGTNCKMIFVGDNAQLPPVGLDISPALNIEYLKSTFNLKIQTLELTEVVRQAMESGILMNATRLREKLADNDADPPFFSLRGFRDIVQITGYELQELLADSFTGKDTDNAVVVCRSNKRANIYNREIRNRILFCENEIEAGDRMMVVKNNYFWLPKESKAGFVANGDIIEILSIKRYEDLYGFRFADITMRMVDYPDEPEHDVKIMLDTIMAETPALPQKEQNRLYQEVMQDYADIPNRYLRSQKVQANPFFNALQVKFSYALTCHKTQGGQWENVFVDQGYINNNMINNEYLRWLYTAVTRSTNRLYLISFKEEFFE